MLCYVSKQIWRMFACIAYSWLWMVKMFHRKFINKKSLSGCKDLHYSCIVRLLDESQPISVTFQVKNDSNSVTQLWGMCIMGKEEEEKDVKIEWVWVICEMWRMRNCERVICETRCEMGVPNWVNCEGKMRIGQLCELTVSVLSNYFSYYLVAILMSGCLGKNTHCPLVRWWFRHITQH